MATGPLTAGSANPLASPVGAGPAKPMSLEDQIRKEWGAYGEWNAGGVDRVAEFADLLRYNGVNSLGDIKISANTYQHNPGGYYTDEGSGSGDNATLPTFVVDPDYVSTKEGREFTLGESRALGFLGNANNDGSYSSRDFNTITHNSDLVGWSARGDGNVSYSIGTDPVTGKQFIAPSWGSSSDWGHARNIAKLIATGAALAATGGAAAGAMGAGGAGAGAVGAVSASTAAELGALNAGMMGGLTAGEAAALGGAAAAGGATAGEVAGGGLLEAMGGVEAVGAGEAAGGGLLEMGGGELAADAAAEAAIGGSGADVAATEAITSAAGTTPNLAATNPALIESASGTAGYGASSAGAGGGSGSLSLTGGGSIFTDPTLASWYETAASGISSGGTSFGSPWTRDLMKLIGYGVMQNSAENATEEQREWVKQMEADKRRRQMPVKTPGMFFTATRGRNG